jgi:hypothetical protein
MLSQGLPSPVEAGAEYSLHSTMNSRDVSLDVSALPPLKAVAPVGVSITNAAPFWELRVVVAPLSPSGYQS